MPIKLKKYPNSPNYYLRGNQRVSVFQTTGTGNREVADRKRKETAPMKKKAVKRKSAKKKPLQAPVGTWRYGCVKRKIAGSDEFTFDLVEVYSRGKAWTEGALEMQAESFEQLIKDLENAAKDLRHYKIITER